MGNTATNVSVGKPVTGGAVFRADTTATLPTDAISERGTAFKCLGFISEDGWTKTVNRESTDIKDWGGTTVMTVQTSKEDKYKMTFIEIKNEEVLKTLHGDENVTGTLVTGIAALENAKELPMKAWIIETTLTDNTLQRTVIPSGKVSEVGDLVYKGDTVIGAEVTITALPDASENTSYTYMQKVTSTQSGTSGQS